MWLRAKKFIGFYGFVTNMSFDGECKKHYTENMKKLLLLASAPLLLISCRPMWLNTVDPDAGAPPEYRLGWEDGCDSGLSAQGGWYYKMMYGFKKRVELARNDEYKQGWNEGFTYCRFSLATSETPGDFGDIGLGDGF